MKKRWEEEGGGVPWMRKGRAEWSKRTGRVWRVQGWRDGEVEGGGGVEGWSGWVEVLDGNGSVRCCKVLLKRPWQSIKDPFSGSMFVWQSVASMLTRARSSKLQN